MNLLTVIVLILFAIFLLRGYRRGFIKSLASIASLFIAILLVNFATPYVTDFLKEQTPAYDYILEKCTDAFSVEEDADAADEQKNDAEESGEKDSGSQGQAGLTATLQEQAIESLPVPGVLKNLLKENNTPSEYTRLAAETFADYVPRYLATLILNIVSFIVTLALVLSFIWLLTTMLDVIANLPILRGINQILGLALGLVQGLVVVWIAFLIITVFANTDAGGQLMDMITESPLLSAIYNANILLDFLQKFA